MFRFRVAKERNPFTQTEAPHQKTTGIESRHSTQPVHSPSRRVAPSIGAMASTTTGIPKTTESQNLRARAMDSESSSFGIRGSSAIPHFGQSPGLSRRISGCIGHVKRDPSAEGIAPCGDCSK